jgi:hypothetical protein
MPTISFLSILPNTTPAGLWKVLGTIAERMPADQLIWLALMLCVLILGITWLAYRAISHLARSRHAGALLGLIHQHTRLKSAISP